MCVDKILFVHCWLEDLQNYSSFGSGSFCSASFVSLAL